MKHHGAVSVRDWDWKSPGGVRYRAPLIWCLNYVELLINWITIGRSRVQTAAIQIAHGQDPCQSAWFQWHRQS